MEKIELTTSQCCFSSNDEEFVGFEEDVEQIIQKLTRGTKEREVISIVGMAGLGKTSLAKKVYNNHYIADHFDVRAFCIVSQTYSIRKLLFEILKQVTGEKRDMIKEDEDVADTLRKALFCKRYLIVLDDMWNYEAWEDLQSCFPCVERGSRIMVTTRVQEVAIKMSDPYFLRFLTEDESWELLQKKVFKREGVPLELEEAGFEVARNCKGLPLVIVLNAGIIAQKERRVSVWEEFAKDLSSLGLEEQSRKAIQSSYDYLCDHLKHCLLYIGYFPEDYNIPVSDLLKLWIAEELVPNINDTENLEKSSKDCLSDLVNRSLLMVSKRRSNGDIKYCMVHDLIREFCSSKLEEEDFKQRIASYNSSSEVPSSPKDPARLCMYIHDNFVNQLELHGYSLNEISMVDSEEKESLEFIAHPRFYSSKCMDLVSLLINLRLIRVLHLLDINMDSTWEFQNSPASTLESLTHLKYLAIYAKKFDFKWVSHMIDLQTLRVHSHQRIKTSPDIWKMKKLRHVDITEFSFIWEDDEQEEHVLDNLKTFGKCRVSLADMNRKFWWRFPNLEELSLSVVNFHGMPNHSLFPTPEIHNRLQSLEISFPIGFSTSIGWFKSVFPMNVRFLSLAGISLTEEVVTSIAALQKLETLKLFFIHFPNNNPRWDVTDREFKVLKYLKLELVDMNQWESLDTSFPMLEKLVIKDCEQLEEIPSSFADIPTLRLIKLINCSESVRDSAQSIKEEVENTQGYERLQLHIPKNF
ncbi:hypothetical protein MTR67_021545 [Solanum verrucosum]|uniref:NB-ARC domain-containing protein n=1 Tax=Solanum verrucosum TaxID=315347 RepID=A0AAF0QT31_SOLVR|nr:putative late blight resistance protein homolog R1B-12 [Solanum verrucosum]WMV28160.1 hypothetical protein MTR67_021545 [Solanum verrucosum]